MNVKGAAQANRLLPNELTIFSEVNDNLLLISFSKQVPSQLHLQGNPDKILNQSKRTAFTSLIAA